jgi:chromate transporter
VTERGWLGATEFEDGVAATNLLPGPASTQLAIFCAWRIGGPAGAVVGGLCFIVPGLVVILGLAALFLSGHPPLWLRGAAAAAALLGQWIVLVLAASGIVEVVLRSPRRPDSGTRSGALPLLVAPAVTTGGIAALAWVALKVGLFSYGGGFVIVPLMQHDAVHTYHWMTATQFVGAVAMGQITPGPVVQTVAVVGYAASGLAGGLLAAAVAFAPSFVLVLVCARHFDRLRASVRAQCFLTGAGAAAIGAIAGSAIPLGLAIGHAWQVAVLALAAVWLLLVRRGVVSALVGAAACGVLAALAGAPVPH